MTTISTPEGDFIAKTADDFESEPARKMFRVLYHDTQSPEIVIDGKATTHMRQILKRDCTNVVEGDDYVIANAYVTQILNYFVHRGLREVYIGSALN